MRVLHIITRMILGGAQENTMLSIFGQAECHNCEVALITGPTTGPEGTIVPLLEKRGIPVFEEPAIIRNINPTAELKALSALQKKIREWQPDVVHTHSSKAGVLGRIAAWREKVPFVVHTIHGLPFHPFQTAFKNFIYIAAEKFAAKRCHKIVSVADAMTEQALAAGVGKAEQYRTIYSGMEVEPFIKQNFDRLTVRREFGFKENDFVIGKVARLFELKGHEYLFEAFAELCNNYDNLKLFLIGDGILREKFERIAEQNGFAEKVVFAGLVAREKIPEVIAASDMIVHCSLREGLARVLPQALLSEKPLVCFDVDGAREVVINDKTGYLIPPRDTAALATAVKDIIENQEKALGFAAAGKMLCRERFDWKVMAGKLFKLYEEGLGCR